MADEAQRFCARWLRNEPAPGLLVLAGNSGTGKTHVARAIHNFASLTAWNAFEGGKWGLRVPTVLFLRWPEVCDGMKQGSYGVIDDAANAGLLVVDDVGAEHDPSRNATDKLCQILSRREKRFTVITTNIGPDAWGQRFDLRVADRLLRNSVVLNLDVPSYAYAR
jgi:DNA replication protein DnaC